MKTICTDSECPKRGRCRVYEGNAQGDDVMVKFKDSPRKSWGCEFFRPVKLAKREVR